jgi:peroxiredoxin
MNRRRYHLVTLATALGLGCGGAASPPPPPVEEPAPAPAAQADEASIAVTPELGHPHIGDSAPDFELSDADGQTIRLSSLRGQPVLLALVSSWCPFSQAEQANLAQLGQEYASKGVKIVAVVVADTEAGYQKYVTRVPMGFPVLFDASGDVARAYAPEHAQPTFKDRRKVPVTANLVLDGQGAIRFFTLVDTVHFDAKLEHARRALDALLAPASGT